MAARTAVKRRRIAAVVALAAVVTAGLAVHTLLPDSAVTDIAGDALYAAAVAAFIVVLAPRWNPLLIGGIAAAWCIGIELFQLTGVPVRVAEVFAPAVLVLGTVFDARDLVVYVLAIAVVTAVDVAVGRSAGLTP
ncbi:DUF2809 domain-containing protein [Microbacterium sp. RU33B]|uniref:DUF2809 domain-containing protein n=1 Tax=Microbacterium sp. RU33B TaxID=1907390 RepID=UPI00095BD91C|nr:DUF2809 domain-containing protein [Microbacterium sp. RU33B]SIT77136.1 Protein of unknown function [Microbacterium sp. RU33B]